jgi:hypothetical protein
LSSGESLWPSRREEIRRLARDGNALQSEAASSIGSGLSIVGKIIGHGALTIFGHVEGEVRASTIVIAEGAQIEGEVSAEELTIGGYVKGTIDANRVQLNSTNQINEFSVEAGPDVTFRCANADLSKSAGHSGALTRNGYLRPAPHLLRF